MLCCVVTCCDVVVMLSSVHGSSRVSEPSYVSAVDRAAPFQHRSAVWLRLRLRLLIRCRCRLEPGCCEPVAAGPELCAPCDGVFEPAHPATATATATCSTLFCCRGAGFRVFSTATCGRTLDATCAYDTARTRHHSRDRRNRHNRHDPFGAPHALSATG